MTRRHNDYLLVALAISLLVHMGILAWRFATHPPRPSMPALEVVLVNAHSDTAPAHAQASDPSPQAPDGQAPGTPAAAPANTMGAFATLASAPAPAAAAPDAPIRLEP